MDDDRVIGLDSVLALKELGNVFNHHPERDEVCFGPGPSEDIYLFVSNDPLARGFGGGFHKPLDADVVFAWVYNNAELDTTYGIFTGQGHLNILMGWSLDPQSTENWSGATSAEYYDDIHIREAIDGATLLESICDKMKGEQ